MPRKQRFYFLRKPKIRQSWNKYNLYNLSQYRSPVDRYQTFFQQKWAAKSVSRAYHGEHVKERQWNLLFRPRPDAIAEMDPKALAKDDGARDASGRGSGLNDLLRSDAQKKQRLGHNDRQYPYMNMVYGPLERRLDTAIWRAMFASSARQARQFVVHGHVKVNGRKMNHPGYLLNPGDMFQVEPEAVMYATGAPKDAVERREGRRIRRKSKAAVSSAPPGTSNDEAVDITESNIASGTISEVETKAGINISEEQPQGDKLTITDLMQRVKTTLLKKEALSTAQKREMRDLQRLLRRNLSRDARTLDAQVAELVQKLDLSADQPNSSSSSAHNAAVSSDATPNVKSSEEPKINSVVTPSGMLKPQDSSPQTLKTDRERLLRAALAEARDNPIDPTKPYATPWRPREWMSPFAFIPRYLEVHHRICSAVYLRHPVVRPGLAEVPTPFGDEVNGLAFNWYLRRR